MRNEGLTNAEIAKRRGRAIANQIARIFEKLAIGSRAELVRLLSTTITSWPSE